MRRGWGWRHREDGQFFCAAGELQSVSGGLTEIKLWKGKDVVSVELIESFWWLSLLLTECKNIFLMFSWEARRLNLLIEASLLASKTKSVAALRAFNAIMLINKAVKIPSGCNATSKIWLTSLFSFTATWLRANYIPISLSCPLGSAC